MMIPTNADQCFWVEQVVFGRVATMFLANRAMQFLSSSSVSLIVASEPLWAAVTAVLCLGEAGEESKQT